VYLKSITLKGFKSFPDRTRLEFGSGVSVIVEENRSWGRGIMRRRA